jgi:hypothetical protein
MHIGAFGFCQYKNYCQTSPTLGKIKEFSLAQCLKFMEFFLASRAISATFFSAVSQRQTCLSYAPRTSRNMVKPCF